MQCVIICAGKGTRMRPLTEHLPKPLIEVCDKPLIQHVVEALPKEVDELILVVGYLQEQIRAYCGNTFLEKKVTYVEQSDYSGGTGAALLCAKELLHGRFMLMYADDIHGADALREAVTYEHAILAAMSDHPEDFGVLVKNDDGTMQSIIEKPQNPPSNLVNIGGFVLDTHIFEYEVAVSSDSGELYVTDMFTQYAQDYPVQIVKQDLWIPVGKPEDIHKAAEILCLDYNN